MAVHPSGLKYNKKEVWILESPYESLGSYTSEKMLKKAVDYWMVELPCHILNYKLFNVNSFDPLEWGWAYIPVGYSRAKLKRGGASFIPPKKFFGTNLIFVDWSKEQMDKELAEWKLKWGYE